MRRITPASEERWDLGSGETRPAAKSLLVVRGMQMPLATRPQRPARWLAALADGLDQQLFDLVAVAVDA